ncbi:MAG: hypothetical protein KDC98_00885 [Planctomycetes bacterium]|nr:hypothetical protein [Planctomycetota bacterium]
MTKSAIQQENASAVRSREPRPFLFLEPRPATSEVTFTAGDIALLDELTCDSVAGFTRSLVNHTIAMQNRRALEHGNVQPIQVSVLNRRRRAARAWILAILAGRVDAGTLHAAATQWLPTLAASGPDLARSVAPATRLIEFVCGAVTARIFAAPAANLLPHARALHLLETTLASHLGAVREAARTSATRRG